MSKSQDRVEYNPASDPFRRAGLLPLGAMVAALALAPDAWADNAVTEDPSVTTMPTVHVKDGAETSSGGYKAPVTQIGKITQQPRDVPQSLTIVPEQLMADRNADSLKEALRNVAGLTFNAGEGGRIGDNITLRGYSIVGDLYLDGMRDVAQYNRETFNLQQVDVLRGSASMLFGRGTTGGVVNQESKRPMLKDESELVGTVGSYGYRRVTADVNKVIGEGAAIRVNAMKTESDSFRDAEHTERSGVAPSISWGIGSDNEFTLAYYHLQDDNLPDYGVPYYNGRPLDVPVNRFYGLANADYERNKTDIYTATYVHHFDDDSTLKTVLRKADYSRDLWATAPRLIGTPISITDSTAIRRQRQARGGEEHTLTSQTDYSTLATTGSVEHELLAGLELVQEKAHRWNYTSAATNPATTVGNPNPNPTLPANYFSSIQRTGDVNYTANSIGVYAQDMLTLTPDWKVLLGARWDQMKADYDRPAAQGDLSRTDREWSYRTGLIYQPSKAQSYYLSYGTSFNPSAELYALDDRSTNTPPEQSRNLELGAKWEALDGKLSLRTALFRSQKLHERNTDLADPDVYLLSGKRHTDGVEFEVSGNLTDRLEVFGGLALMKGRIDEASGTQANTKGKVPINTPHHTANLWMVYNLGGGWKVGGGFEDVGLRYGNATNTNAVPGYSRWDAMVAYEQKRYSIKLNVLNLFNQKYYEGVYAGHVVPGTRRAVQLSGEFRF